MKMKKWMAGALVLSMGISMLGGCGAKKEAAKEPPAAQTAENKGDKPEKSVVTWNYGTSGNVLVTIADEKGYFKEEGLTIEPVQATQNADAMALLSSGKVDIVSNSGTSNPLQQIAAGVDLTIFGGHMLTGAMPVIAKKGTKWNGVEDFVGKKVACNPAYFALTGAVMDKGYENPLEAVEWVTITNYNDAIAAVKQGEVDYALLGTGQNFSVKNMDDVDIMCYQSDIMPNYSCCRMEAKTDFVKNNPNTVKAILRSLIRAQEYYESNKPEAIKMQAKAINADEDFVAAYMTDGEHYQVNVDPLKKSVERAWGILDKTGFLSKNAKNINIDDHMNTKLYEEALAEVTDKYGKENPDFYAKMKTFYTENN